MPSMIDIQELVDEALLDWYTQCHKFDTEEDLSPDDPTLRYTEGGATTANLEGGSCSGATPSTSPNSDLSSDWSQTGLDPRLLRGVIEDMAITNMTPVQKLTIPGILGGQNLIATAETGSGKTLAFVLPICHMILEDLEGASAVPGENTSPAHASPSHTSPSGGVSGSVKRVGNPWASVAPQSRRIKPNSIRCLALSPTREIAIQTQKVIELVTEGLPISSAVICGGLKHNAQEQCLRRGVNFVCACPGRLLDVLAHDGFIGRFRTLRYVVLDEADRMLGLGFAEDVEFIMKSLKPFVKQILLFSASLPLHVHKLAQTYMDKPPMRIGVLDGGGICRCENIREILIQVPSLLKLDLLRYLLLSSTDIVCTRSNEDLTIAEESGIVKVKGGQCIIFTRTKARANRVCERLRLSGFLVERIHGNRSQTARVKALQQFVLGECHILVATDVAARGIDLYEVPLVINFDLPATGEEYTHRAGRTGRAGKEGQCWSFFSEKEELNIIEQGLNRDLKANILPTELNGFSYNAREPTFLMTESGHQNEIFPSPTKTTTAARPKVAGSTLNKHFRQGSATATYHRHRRAPSGKTGAALMTPPPSATRRSFGEFHHHHDPPQYSMIHHEQPLPPMLNQEPPPTLPNYVGTRLGEARTTTPSTTTSSGGASLINSISPTTPVVRRVMCPKSSILQLESGRGAIISDKVVNKKGDSININRQVPSINPPPLRWGGDA